MSDIKHSQLLNTDAELTEDLSSSYDSLQLNPTSGEERLFVCHICGVNFSCQTYLNRHFKNVHQEANSEHQKCPKCSMTFKKYETLWKHVIRVHENPTSSLLEVASTMSSSCKSLQTTLLKDETLVAPQDEKEIDAVVESLISEENESVCKQCGKTFCGKRNVKRHIREVHLKLPPSKNSSGRMSCNICGKSFVNNSVYNAHMRNIHTNPHPTIECPRCWKKFKEIKGLKRHMRDVHLVQTEATETENSDLVTPAGTNIGSNAGNICVNKGDTTIAAMENEDTVFTCTVCEISFVSLDGLNRHEKNIHEVAAPGTPRDMPRRKSPSKFTFRQCDPEEFNCSECGKRFSNKSGLLGHSIVHQTASFEPHVKAMLRAVFGAVCNSSLTCGICGTVVMNSVEGRLHVYIKHPEKFDELVTKETVSTQGRLQCTYCSEKLVSSETMIAHIEMCHPDKYVPTCTQCGHKELKERDINLHFKQFHPDVHRYSCDVCKRSFNQRRNLEHHMSREHSAHSVQCPYCPEKHVKVKLHVTVKHPEKAEEFTQIKKAALKEEQEARMRFNQFLEKGTVPTAHAASPRKKAKVAINDKSELSYDIEEQEGETTDDDNPGFIDEDQKPNIRVLKESPKIAIPAELYTLQKYTTTPHLIEIRRLPPLSSPHLPTQSESSEKGPNVKIGEEGSPQLVDNEDDVKPDINNLKLAVINTNLSDALMGEKTLSLRLERLTEEEIIKWTGLTKLDVSTSSLLLSANASSNLSDNNSPGVLPASHTSRKNKKRGRK